MTNNSPFDDHIKKQFGNYQPEVPPHIWENIMAEKEKEKPAGFFFFLRNNKFIFISLVLLGVAAGALLVNNIYKADHKKMIAAGGQAETDQPNTKDQKHISKNVTTENKNEASKNETVINSNTEASQSQNISPANTAGTNNETSGNDKTNTVAADKIAAGSSTASGVKDPAHNKADAANTKNNDNTSLVGSINPNDAKRKVVRGGISKNLGGFLVKNTISKDVKNKTVQNQAGDVVNTDAATTDQASVKNKKKTNRSAGRTSMVTQNPGAESTVDVKTAAADIKEPAADVKTAATEEKMATPVTTVAVNNNDFFMKNYYLTLDTKLAEKESSLAMKNTSLSILKIPCPGSYRTGKRYFEVYGGPDYAFRILSDTANSTYLQKRKESTHLSSAYSFGVRYTRVFNNSLSIRTGINFSQVNERFKFEQGHIVQMIYIIDANGDTTGSYATTGSRYKTTHNRYRTLDIPLQVGYELSKGRFAANINLGLMVNIYSWQKGDVLDTAYQPVSITTGKASSPYQFKTNAGIGVTGGISFYYRLTGKLHFLAEPYFRYNFSAANKSDITLKQKYTTAGLRLGLRMDF